LQLGPVRKDLSDQILCKLHVSKTRKKKHSATENNWQQIVF